MSKRGPGHPQVKSPFLLLHDAFYMPVVQTLVNVLSCLICYPIWEPTEDTGTISSHMEPIIQYIQNKINCLVDDGQD